jgi:hypothetical protein
MSTREANLLWLKDVLDHLQTTREQLQWAEDRPALETLTESMLRDLECCRRLCESIRRKGNLPHAG